MTCSVYPSRKTLLILSAAAILIFAAWAYFFLPRTTLEPIVRVGSGGLVAVALVACLVGLLTRKPVVRVDETGIVYRPKLLPKIEWADVIDVERVPLIEPTPDGLVNHVEDGRRPVNIFVLGSDKYLPRLPAVLRQRLSVDGGADAVRFQIEFVDLPPASAEVYQCIRRHLDGRAVNG